MKKLFGILSVVLLPVVSFAQAPNFRMANFINGSYGCNGFETSHSALAAMYFLIFTPLVLIILVISLFVFWLTMLIDAIKHAPDKLKIIWVLIIIFTHVVGAFVYYFVEKRPRHKIKHTEQKEEEVK